MVKALSCKCKLHDHNSHASQLYPHLKKHLFRTNLFFKFKENKLFFLNALHMHLDP